MKMRNFFTMGYAGFFLLASMGMCGDSIPMQTPSADKPDDAMKISVDEEPPAAQVDLRPFFEKWKLGPRVQGERNTCSVFTVAVALEYALARMQGAGTRLSVEYLNWASNQVLGQSNDGGFFSDLWKGFAAHGICAEDQMPYQDVFDSNQTPSEQAVNQAKRFQEAGFRMHWIKPWDPNVNLTDGQLTAVKQALCREWPVCGGFRWPKNPVKWKDDILETPPSDGVIDGHSVLLVGYRDDPEQPGGGVFLFRNTNNGGREGWMTYEYARAYMNDALWIDYETEEAKIILTPKAGPEPRINGPGVFGCRPGRPFVYRIPCTGVRPLAFSADGLPSGLRLDTQTGILTGSVPDKPGRYEISLSASNASGKSSRDLTLVVGDTLALTPPMGWNSWYIHYADVTEQHMRKAADTMIDSGMADYGYMYVNIDDCWMKKRGDEPYRDQKGSILTNDKFPDIRGMCDYIHAKGLRAGIYTSPGPWTCAGYVGSYGHEEIDVKTFAEWGFDFLKYDLCSYEQQIYAEKVKETNNSLLEYQRPYRLMGELLKQADRDMVYNLCQYGRAEVWKWAGDVEGNCWRTTEDLGHFIEGLSGFYGIGFSNMEHVEYAGPGRWNDPDYLIIGWVGDSSAPGGSRPTALTPNEQYSYMSMWCLMASPLFFSGDMSRLDDFTLNVLCNAEVIEVDQDVLGRQAKMIEKTDKAFILAKPMEDGSTAVGLFNIAEAQLKITVAWSQLGLTGLQRVRDLWRQQDVNDAKEQFTALVPRHGVALIRLWPKSTSQASK